MCDYHGESTLYEIYRIGWCVPSHTQTQTRSTLSQKHTHVTLAAICLPQSNLLKLFIFYCAVYLLTDAFGTLASHHQQHEQHQRFIQPTGKTDTLASKIDERLRTGWANASTRSLDFLDRHRQRSIFGVFFHNFILSVLRLKGSKAQNRWDLYAWNQRYNDNGIKTNINKQPANEWKVKERNIFLTYRKFMWNIIYIIRVTSQKTENTSSASVE